MLNKRIDADGLQVDDIDGSAWPEASPEAFAGEREEGESTHYEAGVAGHHGEGTKGDEAEVLSVGGGVTVDGDAGGLDDSDDWVKGPQGPRGPRGVNMDGDAAWNDSSDDWVEGVGVETHATVAKGTTGNANEYIGASGEFLGASAEAYAGSDRAKLGAQANVLAGEVQFGDGIEVEAGVSVGVGLAGEASYGEDSDKDGYGEWGARVDAGPFALGFKVEPGKIVDFLNPFD